MKRQQYPIDTRIKRKIVGWKEFILTYAAMLLLVGVQMGIIVLSEVLRIDPVLQVTSIMIYWVIVALVFCFITNWQIKKSYDMPMRRLSLAAKKVAGGDFSVYAEPIHTSDNYDYIDVMFLDFNTMVQELGSIETLKNDFISSVSHEIKTPLAIIRNYTAMLKKDGLSAYAQAEYMDTIITATDSLSSLVTNILRLNKLDNQEIGAAKEEFDLCRQLVDCVLQFESLWEQKNIEVHVDVEDRSVITADESMLEIVWNNLLSNAVKFTEPGGTVSLVQTSDSGIITVSISDTGCGMNKETEKHIFEKFYQGDTSHSAEGNGLGLAIAYRVIEKIGGTLTVKSEMDRGSTFTVTIPVSMGE